MWISLEMNSDLLAEALRFHNMKLKNKTHGGARKGAGRKPGKKAFVNVEKKEPTVVMRIPLSKVEAVKKLLNE